MCLIHSDMRVIYGARLLYRLPDSILPVTVTDLTNSQCAGSSLKSLKLTHLLEIRLIYMELECPMP